MTTALALENLTDRSRFELLATSVLRAAVPKYAGIVHTGLNAKGETIVSPVDGIHRVVGSSPPEWVIVQHTTTDRVGLGSKWLAPNDGDIAKSAREAMQIRASEPDVLVTLVLTCNQSPSDKLVIRAHEAGRRHGLEVDIWDASRFVNFLDSEAHGHWLRKQYLGIEAERLSVALLHEIGHRSLQAYRRTALLQSSLAPCERPHTGRLLEQATVRLRSLLLLVGESGYGKSVLAAEVLERWLGKGRVGLWMPPSYLLDGLEAGLERWLHVLYPGIEVDAGRIALGLVSEVSGLLLCVDDLQQTVDPDAALRTLLGAAVPPSRTSEDTTTGVQHSPVTLLAPVRPELLRAVLPRPERESWIHVELLERFLPEESRAVLRGALPDATTAVLEDYRSRLGDDPFLVGLFVQHLGGTSDLSDAVHLLDDIVGEFIAGTARLASRHGSQSILPQEIEGSLALLADEMLARRVLRPCWGDVSAWFSTRPTTLASLRALVAQGTLCRLDSAHSFAFRHDRLMEYLLARAAARMLNAVAPPMSIVADPYFGSVVGEALTCCQYPLSALATLRTSAPWTVFAALRFLNGRSGPVVDELFGSALEWARSESANACDSVHAVIGWSLLATNSARVLPIIEALGTNPVLCLAALRNGSVRLALPYFERLSGSLFEPGIDDKQRERVIEHAKTHHTPVLSEELRALATCPEISVARARALLGLLGHFSYPGFDDVIILLFRRFGSAVLQHALWAAVRCPLVAPSETLAPLLGYLAEMPVRSAPTEELTDRQNIMVEFAFACRQGVCPSALPALLDAANADPRVAPEIASMVEYNDDPDALEYVVRRGVAGIGPGPWDRIGTISDRDIEFVRLSGETTLRLKALWTNEAETLDVRKTAFEVWLRAGGCDDPTSLSVFGAEPPFGSAALQYRLKVADLSAARELIALLRREGPGSFWWYLAHRVWCAELRNFVGEVLGALPGETLTRVRGGHTMSLAATLAKIPVADCEDLLQENWSRLRFDPHMIQVALRLGTPSALSLAREAIAGWPEDSELFEHAFSFGPWSQARADNPVRIHHLRGIEPYLDRMADDVLLRFVWLVERFAKSDSSLADWIQSSVVPRLSSEARTRVGSAREALTSALDAQHEHTTFPPHLGFVFDSGRSGLGLPDREAVGVLRSWLREHSTLRGLEIAAECLRYVGGRGDLEILDGVHIDDDARAVGLIKADARFAVMRRSLL